MRSEAEEKKNDHMPVAMIYETFRYLDVVPLQIEYLIFKLYEQTRDINRFHYRMIFDLFDYDYMDENNNPVRKSTNKKFYQQQIRSDKEATKPEEIAEKPTTLMRSKSKSETSHLRNSKVASEDNESDSKSDSDSLE